MSTLVRPEPRLVPPPAPTPRRVRWAALGLVAGLTLTEDRSVTAKVSFGELVIEVPPGVNLDITSEVRIGESDVLGTTDEGPNNEIDMTSGPIGDTDRVQTVVDPDAPTLTIEAFVGFGRLEITR